MTGMVPQQTKIEKAKNFFTEILEKRDFSWIDSNFSEMFGLKQSTEPDDSKKGTGKIGIKLYLNTFTQSFENSKYTFLNIVESDDQVIIRFILRAKHTGDIFSIKATNRELTLLGVCWFFFDDQELIENIHLIWNGFSLIDQLDLKITPKNEN